MLAEQGAFLDAIYYCPHLPPEINSPGIVACSCRKPATGMVDLAYKEFPQLNRQQSFVVGDKVSDIELGLNCQASSILVKTGYGSSTLQALQEKKIQPHFIAEDVCQAVDWILGQVNSKLTSLSSNDISNGLGK